MARRPVDGREKPGNDEKTERNALSIANAQHLLPKSRKLCYGFCMTAKCLLRPKLRGKLVQGEAVGAACLDDEEGRRKNFSRKSLVTH